MTRRAARKAETRQRILEAALSVFSGAGFQAARMEDIAQAAGITKPTLYQYFDSKQALFTAMMLQPRDAMMAPVEAAEGADPVDRLWAFAWTYADTVMRPEFLSLARLIIAEAQRFPEVGRAYQASGPDRVLQGLARFMAAQGEAGFLQIADPELAAEDFWGLILSAPRNRALHVPDDVPSRAEVARFVQNGIAVFLRAYAAAPQSALARLDTLIAAGVPVTTNRD